MRRCGCHSHNGLLLSPEGLAQREDSRLLSPLGVDEHPDQLYLDKVSSVSALPHLLDCWLTDEEIEEQHRRFLNGS